MRLTETPEAEEGLVWNITEGDGMPPTVNVGDGLEDAGAANATAVVSSMRI